MAGGVIDLAADSRTLANAFEGSRRALRGLSALVILMLAALSAAPAYAHNLTYAVMKVNVDRSGAFEIEIGFHIPALLMAQPQEHLTDDMRERWRALQIEEIAALTRRMEGYFADSLEIFANEQRIGFDSIAFPAPDILRADGLVEAEDARPSAPVIVRGKLPGGTQTLQVAAPLAFSETLLSLANEDGAVVAQVLREGQRSHPFVIGSARGVAVTFTVPAFLVVMQQYAVLGFEHIVPKGLDHILFVLGLFLLTPNWRSLALQVTAFTLAHSVTLALAVFNIISAPSMIVEPLIAATIIAIAFDNVVARDLRTWRTAAVFGFGLLHGLGFASVLRALGLPKGEEALALVSFNIGVEFGQLAALAAAFLLVGWFRHKPWFRHRIAIPASLVIAAIGAFWMIERILANL